MALLIRGGQVINSARSALEPADVLIEADQIVAVGCNLACPPGTEELNATGHLILPGLVNAHTHAHNNLLKGLTDNWTLEDLLTHGPALNSCRTPDEHYLSAAIGAVEMLKTGCTAAYDLFMSVPAPSSEVVEAVVRAYSDNLNMFEAMRIAALVNKVRFPHDQENWVGAMEVYHMATQGSAHALGLADDLREVAPARKADLVLLRANSAFLQPLNQPLNALVYAETGADVTTVLVGGRVVLDQGRVLTVDEGELRSQAQEAADRLRGKSTAAWALARQLRPYVTAACRAAVASPYAVNRYAVPIMPESRNPSPTDVHGLESI